MTPTSRTGPKRPRDRRPTLRFRDDRQNPHCTHPRQTRRSRPHPTGDHRPPVRPGLRSPSGRRPTGQRPLPETASLVPFTNDDPADRAALPRISQANGMHSHAAGRSRMRAVRRQGLGTVCDRRKALPTSAIVRPCRCEYVASPVNPMVGRPAILVGVSVRRRRAPQWRCFRSRACSRVGPLVARCRRRRSPGRGGCAFPRRSPPRGLLHTSSLAVGVGAG
jgi:hypothetical protein